MSLMKFLSNRKGAIWLSSNGKALLKGLLPGKERGDAVTWDQIYSDNLPLPNIVQFTGNNTHTGTETFTNEAGVTTDTLTPATSGAGTSYLRPAGVKTTTPIAATALKSGGVYGLSKADGLAITLPALSTAIIGTTFKFHILTSCTSVGYVFSKGAAPDVFVGGLWSTIANPDAANDMEFNIASGTVNTLTLGATTACGLAGGWVEFTAISTTQWAVNGVVLGSGTLASNLFTTV